jgi:FMN-dependent NADH-azoreductase
MTSVLRIDSSPRSTSSVSRQLGDRILARLGAAQVVSRDITAGLAAVDADWIGANFSARQTSARCWRCPTAWWPNCRPPTRS